jgi:hypothetical protein
MKAEKTWPPEWIEIAFAKEKDIKGKTHERSWTRSFPAGKYLGSDGVPVPEVQTRGIFLFGLGIRSPHSFIPIDSSNNLISGKNRKNAMTFTEFKTLLLNEN